MTYVYIDESGQSKATSSEKGLVVASFASKNQNLAANAFKKWRKRKFPHWSHNLGEIKFSNSGITPELHAKTLTYFASLDIEIRSAFFLSENVPAEFMDEDGPHDGILYVHAIEQLLRSYMPLDDLIFIVCCDKRHIKDMSEKQFTDYLRTVLAASASHNARVEVLTADSASNANLQVADWIVGALATHLNEKRNGDTYYKILEPKFGAAPIEIFPSQIAKDRN